MEIVVHTDEVIDWVYYIPEIPRIRGSFATHKIDTTLSVPIFLVLTFPVQFTLIALVRKKPHVTNVTTL